MASYATSLYKGYDPRNAVAKSKDSLYAHIRRAASTKTPFYRQQAHFGIKQAYHEILAALAKAEDSGKSSYQVWFDEFVRYNENPDKFVEEYF